MKLRLLSFSFRINNTCYNEREVFIMKETLKEALLWTLKSLTVGALVLALVVTLKDEIEA